EGTSPGAHSPQPATSPPEPSTRTSTNTTRRTSVTSTLVSNGAISGIRSSRITISRIFILHLGAPFSEWRAVAAQSATAFPLTRLSKRFVIPRAVCARGICFFFDHLEITPRRQQILRAHRRLPSPHRRISLRNPAHKLAANALLQPRQLRTPLLLPLFQPRRQRDPRGRVAHIDGQILHCCHHARRIQPPLRQQPIRRHPSMQRTRRHSI